MKLGSEMKCPGQAHLKGSLCSHHPCHQCLILEKVTGQPPEGERQEEGRLLPVMEEGPPTQ